jgi:hypothetical protein
MKAYRKPEIDPKMAVLRVRHKGEAKLVGKVLAARRHPLTNGIVNYALLHEESGTQGMTKYGGPGVDALVVYWCIEHGVSEYHHLITGDREVQVIDMEAIPIKGQRKVFDGRDRFIIPWESFRWRDLDYPNPWIAKEIVVEPDDVTIEMPEPPKPKRRGPKPKPEDLQRSLFDEEGDDDA